MDAAGATPQPAGAAARWHVRVVDETGSTNADLLAAAAAGAPDRSVLVARHQTGGRGRLDRRWDAPPGRNLLVSILFRLPGELQRSVQRVALATAAAAREVAGVDAVLKWPNDVLVGDAKLAGVLAQAGSRAGSRLDHVVVGVGVNVGWCPPGAARLGDGIDPLDVLDRLLAALDELPGDVHDPYRAALSTLGRRVRVELEGAEVLGTALDVDPHGRLVVRDDAAVLHVVDAGDVVHLRPAG